MREITDFSDFGLPTRSPRAIRVNEDRTVTEGVVRPCITSRDLEEGLRQITGISAEEFPLSTRVFNFTLQKNDVVVVQTVEDGLPLIISRNNEVIVNFDIRATQAFHFVDSKRPIYTYIPGFNIQMIPAVIRRPLSIFVESVSSRRKGEGLLNYSRLPLTSFEFVVLLLNRVLAGDPRTEARAFQWPSGKSAVFISLHDVDTDGFLHRRECDPLFRLEQNHKIRSTWFIPTGLLKGRKESIDFLLRSGSEVGWHGHHHDHRLPFEPFTTQSVRMLKNSFLAEPENFPTGMRCPKLLKSNHLFELLGQSCQALCYDTSFLRGIVPYYLWLNGSPSKILEIPVTVPTDIGVYSELRDIPRSRRCKAILEAQIARTKKLLEVGGIISIVTHPEKDLTERPEFLDVYEQYLLYIKDCPDIWFATAGELFKYWTRGSSCSTG